MSYEALYRKYRPRLFSQVIGQEHITSTLKNQIIEGHVAHAYLFCGTRGTGKTSVARIFARALNCKDAIDGEPCESCDICIGDSDMDIIEIDGGSNSGVSEVRDLIEKVRFAPVSGKYKVYIIDEVHTLSQNAFTALLKTLEEPPAHVIFILATTEPNKVLPTIHSRCQRFDFRRVSVGDLCVHLSRIFDSEGVTYDSEALRLIAQAGQGSVRDTMSVADQCLAFCAGSVTGDKVRAVLGSVSSEFMFDVVDAIIDSRDYDVLGCVDSVMYSGGDLSVFIRDITQHFRNLMVLAAGSGKRDLLDCTDDEYSGYLVQAKRCSVEKSIRAIDILSETENSMRYLTRPRNKIEASLLKICRPQDEATVLSALERIVALEQKLKNGEIIEKASTPKNKETTQPVLISEPEPPPFEPDIPKTNKVSSITVERAVSSPTQKEEDHQPMIKESGESPSESSAAISAAVFTNMSPAVRTLVKSWHYVLENGTINYLVPKTFQSGMLGTLKKLAPELTSKISAEFPGIVVDFIPEQSASADNMSDMRAMAEQMFGKVTN